MVVGTVVVTGRILSGSFTCISIRCWAYVVTLRPYGRSGMSMKNLLAAAVCERLRSTTNTPPSAFITWPQPANHNRANDNISTRRRVSAFVWNRSGDPESEATVQDCRGQNCSRLVYCQCQWDKKKTLFELKFVKLVELKYKLLLYPYRV